MTPQQRDYDRYVGQIPPGQSFTCETEEGKAAMRVKREHICFCHVCAPCSFCVNE